VHVQLNHTDQTSAEAPLKRVQTTDSPVGAFGNGYEPMSKSPWNEDDATHGTNNMGAMGEAVEERNGRNGGHVPLLLPNHRDCCDYAKFKVSFSNHV
jgi:hypothetical protein